MTKEVTITLTRYNEPNRLLHETLLSLSKQKLINAKVLMLDQIDDMQTREYCQKISTDSVYFEYCVIEKIWLSYARNYAINICTTEILLCIDSDAIADEQRAYYLSETFDKDEKIAIVWWKIIPKYHLSPPIVIRADFIYDLYSMLDHGDETKETQKIVWASYWIHISRLWDQAFLDLHLGRTGWKLLWGEETDLCNRARNAWRKVYYAGKSIIHHQVLPERLNYTRIVKRIYRWGYSRWLQWGKPQSNNKTKSSRNVIVMFIFSPIYLYWYLTAKRHKTWWKLVSR